LAAELQQMESVQLVLKIEEAFKKVLISIKGRKSSKIRSTSRILSSKS